MFTEEPFAGRRALLAVHRSFVYDISIEEHFYRLRGTVRSISGPVRIVLLLRSSFIG